MTDSDLKYHALVLLLGKMFSGNFFSICPLNDLPPPLNKEVRGHPLYCTLQSLHCVKWKDMGQEMEIEVKKRCLEVMGIPSDAYVEWELPKEEIEVPKRKVPILSNDNKVVDKRNHLVNILKVLGILRD